MDVTTTVIIAALIVASSSVVTAIVLARQAKETRRQERLEDRAYQNEQATRAAQMTNILIDTNQRIANRTNESADVLEGKIDVIHGLVNSGLTAAKQSELDAVERDLVSLTALAALHIELGRVVDPGTMAAIEQAQTRADTLRAELVNRRAADDHARAETKENEARDYRTRGG